MNEPITPKHFKPGLTILLVCSLIIVVSLAVYWLNKPKSAGPAQPVASTTSPIAAKSALSDPPAPPALPSALEDKWGIQVASIELIMNGSGILLHYKVVAPHKTALLADASTPAYLLEPASGAKVFLRMTPQMGAARPHSLARSAALMANAPGAFPPAAKKLVAGETYSLVVPNDGSKVRSGNKVAVVIGDARADGFTVN